MADIEAYKNARPKLDLTAEVVVVATSFVAASTCRLDVVETDLETFHYGDWEISKGAMRLGLLMRQIGIQISNDTFEPSKLSLDLIPSHSTVLASDKKKLSLGDELALVAAGVAFFKIGSIVVKEGDGISIVRRLSGLEKYAAHRTFETQGKFHSKIVGGVDNSIITIGDFRSVIDNHLLYFLLTLEQAVAAAAAVGKRKRVSSDGGGESSTMASAAVAIPAEGAAAPPLPAADHLLEDEPSRPIETYGTYPNSHPIALPLPKLGERVNMFKDSAAAGINAVAVAARTSLFVEDATHDATWTGKIEFKAHEPAAALRKAEAAAEALRKAEAAVNAFNGNAATVNAAPDPTTSLRPATATKPPPTLATLRGKVDNARKKVVEAQVAVADAARVAEAAAKFDVTFLKENLAIDDEEAAGWSGLKNVLLGVTTKGQIGRGKRPGVEEGLQAITGDDDASAVQNDVYTPTGHPPKPGDTHTALITRLTNGRESVIRATKAFYPTLGVAIDTVVQYALTSHINLGPKLFGACITEELATLRSDVGTVSVVAREPKLYCVILIVEKLHAPCDTPLPEFPEQREEAVVRASGILFAIEQASRHGILYMDSKLGNFFKKEKIEIPDNKSRTESKAAFDKMTAEAQKDTLKATGDSNRRADSAALFQSPQTANSLQKKKVAEKTAQADKHTQNIRLIDLDGVYSFIVPLEPSINGFKPIFFVNLALFYYALRVDESVVGITVAKQLRHLGSTSFLFQRPDQGTGTNVVRTSLDDRLIVMGQHLKRALKSDQSTQMKILLPNWSGGRFGRKLTTNQIERPPDLLELRKDILNLRGDTCVESTVIRASAADAQTYLDAIQIGMSRQIDFRGINQPRKYMIDLLNDIFDCSWMYFTAYDVNATVAQGDDGRAVKEVSNAQVSKMQNMQRLKFVEKDGFLQNFALKGIIVAKELLRHQDRTMLDILALVSLKHDPVFPEKQPRFLEENGALVVTRRKTKTFPLFPHNEKQIWGESILQLYDDRMETES